MAALLIHGANGRQLDVINVGELTPSNLLRIVPKQILTQLVYVFASKITKPFIKTGVGLWPC